MNIQFTMLCSKFICRFFFCVCLQKSRAGYHFGFYLTHSYIFYNFLIGQETMAFASLCLSLIILLIIIGHKLE